MPLEHRRRACEWFCWTRADEQSRAKLPLLIKESEKLVKQHEARQKPAEDRIGPELYGRAAVAEEGLFSRAGWAGRSS